VTVRVIGEQRPVEDHRCDGARLVARLQHLVQPVESFPLQLFRREIGLERHVGHQLQRRVQPAERRVQRHRGLVAAGPH
jgi:hypothetical protein